MPRSRRTSAATQNAPAAGGVPGAVPVAGLGSGDMRARQLNSTSPDCSSRLARNPRSFRALRALRARRAPPALEPIGVAQDAGTRPPRARFDAVESPKPPRQYHAAESDDRLHRRRCPAGRRLLHRRPAHSRPAGNARRTGRTGTASRASPSERCRCRLPGASGRGFFELTGPEKTVTVRRAAFEGLVRSLKKGS